MAFAKFIKQGRAGWLHDSPSRDTFCWEERRGVHEASRGMRTPAAPEGVAAPRRRSWQVISANARAKRTAALAKLQHKAGG